MTRWQSAASPEIVFVVRINGGNSFPDQLHDLYHCLGTEDDPVIALLGMMTLGLRGRQIVRRRASDGDALFNAIADALADDTDAWVDRLVDPYETVVGTRPVAARDAIRARLTTYLNYADSVSRHQSTGISAENEAEAHRCQQPPFNQFFKDIGLTTDDQHNWDTPELANEE